MAKKRAVFLDRDGTLIRQVEVLHKISEVRILPGVARVIRLLNRRGYLVAITTNQPVVARGIIGSKEVDEIHAAIIERLRRRGAKIDAVYFCPHHPHGDVKKYRVKCRCRKPEIGMIMKAVKEHGIDLKKSFMVGDTTRDVLTGNRAGLTTILVKTGFGGKDPHQFNGKPDFVARNLKEAARFILRISKRHGIRTA
jgi:D-glycero-D-manno-heptose 1,7-bisphosphate phosphatase